MSRLPLGALVASLSFVLGCDAPPEPDRAARRTAEARPAPTEFAVPALASSASASASQPAPAPVHRTPVRVALDEKAMGTHISIAAYTNDTLDEPALREKLGKALAEIRRLEGLMTTWRDDSEISRVNAGAGKTAAPVSPETLAVIEKSVWMSHRSEGVFDITFEAMHGLWKFDQDLEERIPDRGKVEAARRLIDWRKIKIDHDARTVMLEKAGMRMSLGGIAKGYAVDAAARVLGEEGLSAFFVQAGGDLFVRGKKPDGSPFRVGVRDPRGRDANDWFAMLEVVDHAFSTAGDYERGFIKDGKRYHHIIDPRTGFPATACRSVTIWAKDAFTADAVDDAVFILGPEKGLKLVDSLEDAGAVIVDARNKVWVSEKLKDRLHVLRPPTDGT
ncbi:Thiamin biosynthesis lipoprotein ApbE [Minicystis rosea]|nr:Thiamin biosynthesis lipoprotein ApbE [Minicystis rosea]